MNGVMPGPGDAATETDGAAASASTVRVEVVRPPPGLAQGRYEWPAWAIGALGGTVVALGIAFLIWRFLRLRRG